MRAILFDFGGTLDVPLHWLDCFLACYREAGIEIVRSQLDLAYDYATQTAYRAGSELRDMGLRSTVEYLVRHQLEFLRKKGPDDVREVLSRAVTGSGFDAQVELIVKPFVADSFRAMEYSRSILSALSARFKIGVVSNFYGNLDRILDEAGFLGLIGALADSTRLGIFKPDPGIFQAALRQLQVGADEAVMVGDSLDKDCIPAHNAGLATVWLNTSGSDSRDAYALGVDHTITRLEQLLSLQL